MTTTKRRVDRRTQRTRQVLQRVFRDVVQEKGFAAASIREIAERANVNRGTFYLHYADKYMLTDAVVREVFREDLARALPADAGWDRRSLQLLARAVLECLEGKYRHQPRPLFALAEVAPLVERAMQEEVMELLLAWLKQASRAGEARLVPLEQIAGVVSWAIFGPALQWSQEAATRTADEMAHAIVMVLMEGVAHLVPGMAPRSSP